MQDQKKRNPPNVGDGEEIAQHEYPKVMGAIRTELIDPDTQKAAHIRASINRKQMKLVFSDEFNTNGRTFYENDDQFLQAQYIHYVYSSPELTLMPRPLICKWFKATGNSEVRTYPEGGTGVDIFLRCSSGMTQMPLKQKMAHSEPVLISSGTTISQGCLLLGIRCALLVVYWRFQHPSQHQLQRGCGQVSVCAGFNTQYNN